MIINTITVLKSQYLLWKKVALVIDVAMSVLGGVCFAISPSHSEAVNKVEGDSGTA
jgi:hypothetical protein